jgi:hypothetical protein
MDGRKRRMCATQDSEIEVEGVDGLDILGRVVVAVASSEQSMESLSPPPSPPGDPGYLMYLLAMVDHVRTKARKRDRSGSKKSAVPEGQSIAEAIAELERSWNNMSEVRRSEWRAQSSILEDSTTTSKARYWASGACSVSHDAS